MLDGSTVDRLTRSFAEHTSKYLLQYDFTKLWSIPLAIAKNKFMCPKKRPRVFSNPPYVHGVPRRARPPPPSHGAAWTT